ncbi:hypothetical protein MASR2M39_13730 [Ignavibacteriales bacterium]
MIDLGGRALHEEVNKYCKAELMQENYFHAVFEATKGLAQRIRELSNTDGDGANLIDKVFMGEKPILAINTLMTETEKSEQGVLQCCLKGVLLRCVIRWHMSPKFFGKERTMQPTTYP